ncbi:MAG: hypothetical protein COC10_08180 [Sphingobium sp.]|nr:MAG: hypothetical protein COC10_08180 [Sphingobium sp.]
MSLTQELAPQLSRIGALGSAVIDRLSELAECADLSPNSPLQQAIELAMIQREQINALQYLASEPQTANRTVQIQRFDAVKWLADFEADGGGFLRRDGAAAFLLPGAARLSLRRKLEALLANNVLRDEVLKALCARSGGGPVEE